jgi:phosphatidylserine/phosphatidylglycerophosphate/cardiolipin synthase-like enzyme
MASMGDYAQRGELIPLLKMCNVTFEKTGIFTRGAVWNQCNEYIYISIIPDKLCLLKLHTKYIKDLCYEIYPVSDEYALSEVYFKPGTLSEYEEVSQEILFDNIHGQIVEEIRGAKYVIWIAMAWFTDPTLYAELIKKKKQGVTIEIVIDDNQRNRDASFH